MSVSEKLGGISGITVAAVIITGIFGAVAAPLLAKLLRIKNPVGIGVGLGCSCHAIGTARALEFRRNSRCNEQYCVRGSRYDDRYYFLIFISLGYKD